MFPRPKPYALNAVVGRRANASLTKNGDSAAKVEGAPLLENFAGNDLLANETPTVLNMRWLALLMIPPPFVVLAIVVAKRRSRLLQLAGRFGSGYGRVRKQIEQAKDTAEVRRALHLYLVRRFARSASSADSLAVVGVLRSSGFRNVAVRCERILNSTNLVFGSDEIDATRSLDEMKHEALAVLEGLQTERRRQCACPTSSEHSPPHSKRRPPRVSPATSTILTTVVFASAVILIGLAASAAETPSSPVSSSTSIAGHPSTAWPNPGPTHLTLTMYQKESILNEANDTYQRALQTAAKDAADAKQAFADAAEKYQLLVDSGVTNSRLYFNLATANLQSGQSGKAIANYQRSLRIDPTNRESRVNLAYAERAVNLQPGASNSTDSERLSDYFGGVNRWIYQRVSLWIIGAAFIFAWIALWLAIGMKLLAIRFPWKSVITAAILVGFVSAGPYSQCLKDRGTHIAVVVSPSVTLREGDGENFATLTGAQSREGQAVELIKRRGNWLQVRTQSGQPGWLLDSTVEII